MAVICDACNQPLTSADEELAKNQENHPGILGMICQTCYRKAVDERPELPWEDPISGEVDYVMMQQDLGVDCGDDMDWEENLQEAA